MLGDPRPCYRGDQGLGLRKLSGGFKFYASNQGAAFMPLRFQLPTGTKRRPLPLAYQEASMPVLMPMPRHVAAIEVDKIIPPTVIACPDCSLLMRLVTIVPDTKGDLYTYQCAKGHRE